MTSVSRSAFSAEVTPASAPAIDPSDLRNVLGQFATGVTVVTTEIEGSPVGVTANSFTSVSLSPPLILFCLGKSLGCLEAFQQADGYAINVLSDRQKDVSGRFAKKGIDRFAETEWHKTNRNIPVIANALATIECVQHSQLDAGDHVVYIGEVVDAHRRTDDDPLLYFGGQYRQLLAS